MQLRLVHGQRRVLAQLPQELAFTAAEAIGFPAGCQEHAKHLAFDLKRGGNQRAQTASREPPGKRQRRLRNVRFVHQLAAQTPCQSICIDRNGGLLVHCQLAGEAGACQADRSDGEHAICWVVGADAAEIQREFILHRADHHLQDARQILPLAYCPGRLLKEAQALQLRVQLHLSELALGDILQSASHQHDSSVLHFWSGDRPYPLALTAGRHELELKIVRYPMGGRTLQRCFEADA